MFSLSLCSVGPPEVVIALLGAGAVEALLNALVNSAPSEIILLRKDSLISDYNDAGHHYPDDPHHASGPLNAPTSLIAALARAIRCIVAAAVYVAGPRDDNLGPPPLQNDDFLIASSIIDHIFQVRAFLATQFLDDG